MINITSSMRKKRRKNKRGKTPDKVNPIVIGAVNRLLPNGTAQELAKEYKIQSKLIAIRRKDTLRIPRVNLNAVPASPFYPDPKPRVVNLGVSDHTEAIENLKRRQQSFKAARTQEEIRIREERNARKAEKREAKKKKRKPGKLHNCPLTFEQDQHRKQLVIRRIRKRREKRLRKILG